MRTGVDFDVSDEQRRRLEAIAGGDGKVKHARRARIVLPADDGLGTMAVMAETGSAKATVWRDHVSNVLQKAFTEVRSWQVLWFRYQPSLL